MLKKCKNLNVTWLNKKNSILKGTQNKFWQHVENINNIWGIPLILTQGSALKTVGLVVLEFQTG